MSSRYHSCLELNFLTLTLNVDLTHGQRLNRHDINISLIQLWFVNTQALQPTKSGHQSYLFWLWNIQKISRYPVYQYHLSVVHPVLLFSAFSLFRMSRPITCVHGLTKDLKLLKFSFDYPKHCCHIKSI